VKDDPRVPSRAGEGEKDENFKYSAYDLAWSIGLRWFAAAGLTVAGIAAERVFGVRL